MMWKFNEYSTQLAAIDDLGNALSYEDLNNACQQFYAAINERCLIFVFCKNDFGTIVGYSACINNNIIPAMLGTGLDYDLFYGLYNSYMPKYLWVSKEDAEKYSDCTSIFYLFDYVLLRTPFSQSFPIHDQLALLLTTSGSTGSPKFVRQSYANIYSNMKCIAQYLELSALERPITTLPMNYTYGLSIINSHLFVGATILLTDKTLMQKEFWDFFKSSEASSFGGVPYTYEILKKLRFFRMDLPSLKTMTQAGGKLTTELHKEFAEFAQHTSKKFIVMYGQCEATARMAYLPAAQSLSKIGSMGISIPEGRFELIDDMENVITTPHTTGELIYYGENVTLGYAENISDLAKGDENSGRLSTGDLALFDNDGYYNIVGRKKRFLKVFGNRVNLDELERLLKSKFTESECACAGYDDHLYIFSVDLDALSDMRRFLSEKTSLNISAFHMQHLHCIPKNDSGKTLYKELERYYAKL